MKVYIVTMYRYGDKESHNYIIGVYTSKDIAIMNGNTEIIWRGNKYYPEVVEMELDKSNDIDTFPNVVVTVEEFKNNTYKYSNELENKNEH